MRELDIDTELQLTDLRFSSKESSVSSSVAGNLNDDFM